MAADCEIVRVIDIFSWRYIDELGGSLNKCGHDLWYKSFHLLEEKEWQSFSSERCNCMSGQTIWKTRSCNASSTKELAFDENEQQCVVSARNLISFVESIKKM